MKTLFVKAHSRLGMKYLPFGGDAVLNIGVEKGPDAVLSQAFMDTIGTPDTYDILSYTFSEPEAVDEKEYYPLFSKETDTLATQIANKSQTGNYNMVVTVGGDHGIGLASVLGTLRAAGGKKVGLIDFDSHGDIHLAGTSPSGNFHGMWLRPLFGDFDEPNIRSIVDATLKPEQCMYIGNMILEGEEERFIRENNVIVIDSREVTDAPDSMQKRITDFCNSMDILHVTFDIDVYKKSLVSATGTPNPDGFNEDMIDTCLAPILDSGKVFALDLVEVNPEKKNPEKTIALAQKVIRQILASH